MHVYLGCCIFQEFKVYYDTICGFIFINFNLHIYFSRPEIKMKNRDKTWLKFMFPLLQKFPWIQLLHWKQQKGNIYNFRISNKFEITNISTKNQIWLVLVQCTPTKQTTDVLSNCTHNLYVVWYFSLYIIQIINGYFLNIIKLFKTIWWTCVNKLHIH